MPSQDQNDFRQRIEHAAEIARTGAAAADTEAVGAQARHARADHTARWVDLQIQQAIARGEFDNLPSAGKPLPDIDPTKEPDWWIKRLMEREQIGGAAVLPEAIALRVDDQQLQDRLDREASAESVRDILEEFNARIVEARRQLQGGPPVVTRLRDIDDEVSAWQERRTRRAQQSNQAQSVQQQSANSSRRRRLFRRS